MLPNPVTVAHEGEYESATRNATVLVEGSIPSNWYKRPDIPVSQKKSAPPRPPRKKHILDCPTVPTSNRALHSLLSCFRNPINASKPELEITRTRPARPKCLMPTKWNYNQEPQLYCYCMHVLIYIHTLLPCQKIQYIRRFRRNSEIPTKILSISKPNGEPAEGWALWIIDFLVA